jgi:beta-xylosidase
MSNPIISHKFTADPTVIVVGETIYLYTGRDEAREDEHAYVMNEWLCFSSNNLVDWKEHAVGFNPKTFSWASGNAYASNVKRYKDKFYWFVSVTPKNGDRKAIGVAVSESPTGPFVDARGTPLIDGRMLPGTAGDNFDPCVHIDSDGQSYIFWGKKVCYHAKLSDDLISIEGKIREISLSGFEEGIHIHKHSDWYYLSYGYNYPEKVGYAMSADINGPWAFKGILNEIAGNCVTNRPCIVEFKARHYFFYHNGSLPQGGSHRRSVCIDHLYYNTDGTIKRVIMTSEGVERL